MTDFDEYKLTKQMEQIRKNINRVNSEWTRTAMQMAESFRPIYAAQLKIAESFRPIYAAQLTMAESFRPLYAAQLKMAESLRPYNNILVKFATIHQEQIQKIFQSIPRVSYDIDFANIDLSYMDKLVLDLADEDIDADSLVLTESEFQQVFNKMTLVTQNITLTVEEYLNILFEYANNTVSMKIKIWVLNLIHMYITATIIAMSPVSPTDLAQRLNPSVVKVESSQQTSQLGLQKPLPEQVNQYKQKQVKSPQLNVRNEPSIDSKVISELSFGMNVKILRESGNWLLVRWNGADGTAVTGWVDKQYLTELKETPTE